MGEQERGQKTTFGALGILPAILLLMLLGAIALASIVILRGSAFQADMTNLPQIFALMAIIGVIYVVGRHRSPAASVSVVAIVAMIVIGGQWTFSEISKVGWVRQPAHGTATEPSQAGVSENKNLCKEEPTSWAALDPLPLERQAKIHSLVFTEGCPKEKLYKLNIKRYSLIQIDVFDSEASGDNNSGSDFVIEIWGYDKNGQANRVSLIDRDNGLSAYGEQFDVMFSNEKWAVKIIAKGDVGITNAKLRTIDKTWDRDDLIPIDIPGKLSVELDPNVQRSPILLDVKALKPNSDSGAESGGGGDPKCIALSAARDDDKEENAKDPSIILAVVDSKGALKRKLLDTDTAPQRNNKRVFWDQRVVIAVPALPFDHYVVLAEQPASFPEEKAFSNKFTLSVDTGEYQDGKCSFEPVKAKAEASAEQASPTLFFADYTAHSKYSKINNFILPEK